MRRGRSLLFFFGSELKAGGRWREKSLFSPRRHVVLFISRVNSAQKRAPARASFSPCADLAVTSPQRSLSAPAAANTSWTSSSWRCWTDTGTPSASSAPTVRLRWRTNVSPGQGASTARRISSSQWFSVLLLVCMSVCLLVLINSGEFVFFFTAKITELVCLRYADRFQRRFISEPAVINK